MEIIIGKNAGFCYGVKRAVEGAEENINENKKIYCLGEIVHNKDVVKSLEEKGITFIDEIDQADGTVIIRAHGIPKEVYEQAQKNKIDIKDFTCPKVLKIHEIAQEYANQGYYIFLTGSAKHPENIGTISYCGENYSIIETPDNVDEIIKIFEKSGIKKLLLISQTTYSVEKFKNIKEQIENKLSKDINLVIKNTICATTKIRQEETVKIAKDVDLMIIIGGKNSSNTKKLYEISKEYCENSILIENENDFNENILKNINKIGVMAGASTPYTTIENVIKKIKTLD
ncbi:MAG: 4-hydroxy-3-methylbut-2-enyl diphosphate reductase [Clostridia bacterium]|nr:4-hydroxy-3-methylbut-2-enyl diphosphate reductase [Clostridia bacterium]